MCGILCSAGWRVHSARKGLLACRKQDPGQDSGFLPGVSIASIGSCRLPVVGELLPEEGAERRVGVRGGDGGASLKRAGENTAP